MQRNCRKFVAYVEGCDTLIEIYVSIQDSMLNIIEEPYAKGTSSPSKMNYNCLSYLYPKQGSMLGSFY
jgi:hypothetical protein